VDDTKFSAAFSSLTFNNQYNMESYSFPEGPRTKAKRKLKKRTPSQQLKFDMMVKRKKLLANAQLLEGDFVSKLNVPFYISNQLT